MLVKKYFMKIHSVKHHRVNLKMKALSLIEHREKIKRGQFRYTLNRCQMVNRMVEEARIKVDLEPAGKIVSYRSKDETMLNRLVL